MTIRRSLIAAAAAVCALASAISARAANDASPSVLAQIQKRGFLSCGVTDALAGFAQRNEAGEWSGFDVDYCRAVAAAIFDDSGKVRFTALAARERAGALQSGWVDLLAGGAPWTQSRDAGQRLLYAAISFHDGQGFLTRVKQGMTTAHDLAGRTICARQGTSYELELADFFHARKTSYEARLFATLDEAAKAYDAGQCEALTADLSALHAARAKLPVPSDHATLPDLISKAPHGPIVRQGDGQWFNIARWTLFAMLDAEELDVSSANADEAIKSENPEIRRLLGVDGEHGEGLGLSTDWAYRIVKHVGNYGEAFERNLGQGSPLAMERRLNALWSKGGLMYAPPVR
jgi:general L-amino acid transport system substrate-binding protein